MARDNPLPDHVPFTPTDTLVGDAAQDWARGFRERTLHPLEAVAAKAKALQTMTPEELVPQMLGVGMMAGVGAKTADLAKLAIARELRATGATDKEIHAQTGWFFGAADGKPRFEISDDASVLAHERLKITGSPMKDVLQHEKLFEAYPHLRELIVSRAPGIRAGEAGYGKAGVGIGGSAHEIAQDPERARSSLHHELQHAIQTHEDFAIGGSPAEPLTKQADVDKMKARWTEIVDTEKVPPMTGYNKAMQEAQFSAYEHLAGETEARSVQKRLYLTPEQRASFHPVESYDIPVASQRVKKQPMKLPWE